MKALKFAPHLIESLRNGTKTTTWRLFDDKDLRESDDISLVDAHSLEIVGTARIESIVTKRLEDITDEELLEHGYANDVAMYENLRTYYGDRVTPETDVKMIAFSKVRVVNPS